LSISKIKKLNPTLYSDSLENKIRNKCCAQKGVESRPVFYPLSKMPAFAEYPTDLCSNSENISSRGISLPPGSHVREEDLEIIHSAFNRYCNA